MAASIGFSGCWRCAAIAIEPRAFRAARTNAIGHAPRRSSHHAVATSGTNAIDAIVPGTRASPAPDVSNLDAPSSPPIDKIVPEPAPAEKEGGAAAIKQIFAVKLAEHITDEIWAECRECKTKHYFTRGWAARNPEFPCDHCPDFKMHIEGVSKKNAEIERELRILAGIEVPPVISAAPSKYKSFAPVPAVDDSPAPKPAADAPPFGPPVVAATAETYQTLAPEPIKPPPPASHPPQSWSVNGKMFYSPSWDWTAPCPHCGTVHHLPGAIMATQPDRLCLICRKTFRVTNPPILTTLTFR